MSFLRNLYFFQGQKYTSFGKNILHRQSASLGHSATGHSGHYAKRALTPRSLNLKLGLRRNYHKGPFSNDVATLNNQR